MPDDLEPFLFIQHVCLIEVLVALREVDDAFDERDDGSDKRANEQQGTENRHEK